jgi:hypothetical protein
MRCSVRDGLVSYHEHCPNPPEFVVETLAMGFPSEQLVPVAQDAYCVMHFVEKMMDIAIERVPTTAGVRVVRLSHWNQIDHRPQRRSLGQ